MPRTGLISIGEAAPGDSRNIGVPASRLAAIARCGLPAAEGFIVPQAVLDDVLRHGAAERLRELGERASRAGSEERTSIHREAAALLLEAELPWELEVALAKALEPMPEGAWLAPSREDGGTPVFAPVRTKNAIVGRVREIWSTAIDLAAPELWHEPYSPIVAISAQDYEVSGIAEMSAGGGGHIDVEAVFGLPQALSDRKIARDRYRWLLQESKPGKAETVRQRWQYAMSEKGVARVDVAVGLAAERKLSDDALAGVGSAVRRAAEALGGSPAVVWGLADEEARLLWVLDLKEGETNGEPKPAEPSPALVAQHAPERLPVTATKLMVFASAGADPPPLPDFHATFPLTIDGWVKSNLAAHPQSPEGASMDGLKEGLAAVLESYAKAARPREVVVSLSNLSSEDFATLPGGERFESRERNPLMGFRGGARHLSAGNDRLLDAELAAVALARRRGARNLSLALPFVRTTDELSALLSRASRAGLERGQDFKVWMFVEVPSNVFLAEEFARLCDGLVIRLEPLYHLLSAVDPGSSYLADAGFARPSDEGARRAVSETIRRARSAGRPTVLCGEGLHEAREVLETAIREGVDAVSAPASAALSLARGVAAIEQRLLLDGAARLRGGGRD